jgi:O-succinylbenzoic acid--CoA ligase
MPFLRPIEGEEGAGIAIEDGSGLVTFRDLEGTVSGLAEELEACGVQQGTVVGVLGTLDRTLIQCLHAAWRIGGVVAPFHPGWTESELRVAFESLRPQVAVLGGGVPEKGIRLAGRDGRNTFTLPSELTPERDPPPPAELSEETVVARLLTSGTGGTPKVVELTEGNLRASAEAAGQRLALGPSDRWLASLSIAHVGGLALVTRAGLLGSRLVLAGAFDASRVRGLMDRGRITHASLVPTMLRRLLDTRGPWELPEELRCLLVGGAAIPRELLAEALERGLPVALTYGLSEASSQVATAPPDLVRAKPGTVGAPLAGTEVRIGPSGTIQVKGRTVAPGQAGPDGWLDTGDQGKIDPDGHLWVTGRITNRIISGGVTVDPEEVEAILRTHPSVRDAVVVGLPDPEWGERIVAAVVVPAAHPGLVDSLHEFSQDQFSPGRRPRAFEVVDSIPLNPNGKIDRPRVRRLFHR